MTHPHLTPRPTGGFTRPVMLREPAVVIGTATAVVVAVLTLLVEFGIDVTSGQQAAIVGVVAVLAPLVQAVVTRAKVYAPATVDKIIHPSNGRHVAGKD